MLNSQLAQITNDDFDFLSKNGKRTSVFMQHDFESLIFSEWGLLKFDLPDLFSSGNFEELLFLLLKDRNKDFFKNSIENYDLSKAIEFILWIKDELETIKELEKTYLSSDPSAKMFQAGINKLDQFGIMNTVDNLAGGDILKYELIKKQKYNVIFDKQYREVITNEIQTKLAKLK
jgi:hypothetical protein